MLSMSELLRPENLQMMKKNHDNFQWFVNHYDELKEKYKGKFIAINDGKVIGEDSDQSSLLERLAQEIQDVRSILIQYIKEKDYLTVV